MEIVLDNVLLVSARSRFVRLRPFVSKPVVAAKLKRDKMVDFAALAFNLRRTVENVNSLNTRLSNRLGRGVAYERSVGCTYDSGGVDMIRKEYRAVVSVVCLRHGSRNLKKNSKKHFKNHQLILAE